MKVHKHEVNFYERPIHFVESWVEIEELVDWIRYENEHGRPIAVDTETTGLDIFSPGFSVRLVQFGSISCAWVVPVNEETKSGIRMALSIADRMVIHNASFDIKALNQVGLLPYSVDEAWKRSIDTKILAHLVDPIGKLSLEDVYARETGDDQTSHTAKAAKDALFKENGWTDDNGWKLVPVDAKAYVVYAGTDVLIASILHEALSPLVHDQQELIQFEHDVARLVTHLEIRGMPVDVDYAERLEAYFLKEAEEAKAICADYGVTNPNSTAQVREALLALGAVLVERTKTGQFKTDKKVLEALAENNEGTPLAELAAAIDKAKNNGKKAKAYVRRVLEGLDANGYVHADIKALEARTARMSISKPPLQQLPSGDWHVRRMFVAPPGYVFASVDYSQVELRVLAALSEEPTMMQAIADGLDLHDVTAELLYGPDFAKAQRKLAKNTNFGRVFGGGAVTLARQAGVTISEAKQAMALYDKGYPGIKRYSKKLMERAEWGKAEVLTPIGRRLPLDRNRLYAATNYIVQSTARDVLCSAMLDLEEAGLWQYAVLPIHDEVLFLLPEDEAEELVKRIEDVMSFDFFGVFLKAEGEIDGPSWGHAYGAPAIGEEPF